MDVMNEADAGEFIECPVSGGRVDRPRRPFGHAGQDLLDRQKPFPMTGEHGANGSPREGEAKPGTSNSFMEQSFESGRVVGGGHRGKGSDCLNPNQGSPLLRMVAIATCGVRIGPGHAVMNENLNPRTGS